MITEDYVSFETAKLLKEKGFNEDSWFHYDADGDVVTRGYRLNKPEDIPAWTLQMAMKWLREKYHLEIYPFHDAIQECNTWWYRVERHIKGCGLTEHESDSIYGKYEDACEAAIKYCLENLI